jgi:hypothetical protein
VETEVEVNLKSGEKQQRTYYEKSIKGKAK